MLTDRYSLVQTQAPASEPISLAEAKLHCRVDADVVDEDGLIADLVKAAREYCETTVFQAFALSSWRLSMDVFPPWELEVPLSPLVAVQSIQYRASEDGLLRTMDPTLYVVDTDARPGRLTPIWAGYWPTLRVQTNAVQISFTAGVSPSDVPARVRQAIRLLVGHWYENREAVSSGSVGAEVKLAVDALLNSVWTGVF